MQKISTKLLILTLIINTIASILISIIIIQILQLSYKRELKELSTTLTENYDLMIKNQVLTAHSLLQKIYDMQQNGKISEEDAKNLGINLLRDLRYGEKKDGYFWADTIEGVCIVLYGNQMEGKNRYNLQDSKSKYFIKEIIENGKQNGGGYTDYWFPKKGETESKQKRGYSLLFKPFGWVIGTGNYIEDINQTLIKESNTKKRFELDRLKILILVIFALFISTIILLIFTQRMIMPISQISKNINEIIQTKDLTKKIKLQSNDDIGKLADSFNKFIVDINNTLINFKDVTQKIQELGYNLATNNEQASATMQEISANMEMIKNKTEILNQEMEIVDSAKEEINKSVKSVNENINNQSLSITETASIIEKFISHLMSITMEANDKKQITDNISVTIKDGNEEIFKIVDSISEISKEADLILQLIDVINNIADQTNLLAMNASIEAAHAGEYGKGFSVVADEIRKLADATQNNSKEITSTLKHTIEKINNTVTLSKGTESKMINIFNNVSIMTETLNTMINKLNEVSGYVEEMSGKMNDLIKITIYVNDSSNNMIEKTKIIEDSINIVKETSDDNFMSIQEINLGMQELSKQSQILAETSSKNAENVEILNSEIIKFKAE